MIFDKWIKMAGRLYVAMVPVLVFCAAAYALSPKESIEMLRSNKDFVDISGIDGVVFDIRYATANNFTGKVLYRDFDVVFLHKDAAEKLKKAVVILGAKRRGYKLLVFDALRPRSVQWELWKVVEGTSNESYVADPRKGSVHNFGMAVDLSIMDDKGRELDMGTAYDAFTKLSEPRFEDEHLMQGRLSKEAVENRRLLRDVMEGAGFTSISNEWWHFDALSGKEVRKKYKIVE